MSKFDAIGRFLVQSGAQEITLSFQQIRNILGFDLPPSALTHSAWWSNTGHSHAAAWTAFGYRSRTPNFSNGTVRFQRSGDTPQPVKAPAETKKPQPEKTASPQFSFDSKKMEVCGYTFTFVQELIPELENSSPKLYNPQELYQNNDRLPLLKYGHGPFCRFRVNLPALPGLYLWVVEDRIVYIGEASDLRRRFNMGYGHISPRNCYLGGQSTNCKMNKVALKAYLDKTPVQLYICPMDNHKAAELILLKNIKTKYNIKDN